MSGRWIVTGASGFVGRRLVADLLAAGCSVAAVARTGSTFPAAIDGHAAFHRVEAGGDAAGLAERLADHGGPGTRLAHLAARYVAVHTAEDVGPLVDANVRFGALVVEAATILGVDRIVTCGSAFQHYGGAPYAPVNLYAATKQAFEDLCRYFANAHGTRFSHLRLFDTYGPGDTRGKVLGLLVDAAVTGRPLALSGGEQPIDLTHVADVSAAIAAAAAEGAGPGRYFVGGRDRLTLRQLAGLVGEVAGRPVPAQFGARPSRDREMMELPAADPVVPDWAPTVDLRAGIAVLLEEAGLGAPSREEAGLGRPAGE